MSYSTAKITFSKDQEKVLNWFNTFHEKFVKGKQSFLVEYEKEFNADIAKECKESLMQNNVLKMDKLKEWMKTLSEEKRSSFCILLWHCYWLMYMMSDTSKNFIKDIEWMSNFEVNDYFLRKGHEIASTRQLYSSGKGIDADVKDTIQPIKYLLTGKYQDNPFGGLIKHIKILLKLVKILKF